MSLDDLTATLAPEMIFGVELDDAAPQVIGTLFEDTVACSAAVLSIDYRALPPRQALKLAAESALSVL